MESKKLVKVTVEHDGEVNVFTKDAALIVAFDVIGREMGMTVAFEGEATGENLAYAVANAIDDIDRHSAGFVEDVMNSLLEIQIMRIAGTLSKDEVE